MTSWPHDLMTSWPHDLMTWWPDDLTYPGVAACDEDSSAPGLVLAAAQQTPHQPRQHACTDSELAPWLEVLEDQQKRQCRCRVVGTVGRNDVIMEILVSKTAQINHKSKVNLDIHWCRDKESVRTIAVDRDSSPSTQRRLYIIWISSNHSIKCWSPKQRLETLSIVHCAVEQLMQLIAGG